MRTMMANAFLLAATILGRSVSTPSQEWTADAQAQSMPQPVVLSTLAAPGDPERLRDEIKVLQGLLPRLPDRGAALYLLAHHYAHLGEYERAKTLLEECVALDEGFDPAGAQAFAPLKSDPAFRELIERVSRRYRAVHRARVAFTVSQTDLFPEGLSVDGARRGFYMSSMYHNKIVRVAKSGESSDFVKQDAYDLMPVGGVHVDPKDRSVWCATDPGEKNRSEIVHFDARGRLIERYAAPGAGSHDLNDLVLREGREVYTTDTYANQVFRFDLRSRTFTLLDLAKSNKGRPLFYPNGITVSDDGRILYVADMLGVLRVDLRTNEVQDVSPLPHDTLAGIDGLYWYKGGLVAVQSGIGASRVMRWNLTLDGRRVVSGKILERGTDLVHNPTTGAILHDEFYFMTNTGIENLDDDGKIVDLTKLEPLHVAVVPLK